VVVQPSTLVFVTGTLGAVLTVPASGEVVSVATVKNPRGVFAASLVENTVAQVVLGNVVVK
jgi:hypothetical protein